MFSCVIINNAHGDFETMTGDQRSTTGDKNRNVSHNKNLPFSVGNRQLLIKIIRTICTKGLRHTGVGLFLKWKQVTLSFVFGAFLVAKITELPECDCALTQSLFTMPSVKCWQHKIDPWSYIWTHIAHVLYVFCTSQAGGYIISFPTRLL